MVAWFETEQRELPFRQSRDPWPVLVAEVMLQQTQASRIAERFDDFMARYPTPQSMAEVPVARVLADWSGLGYNRRALNLHAAAAEIARHGWPATVAELQRLPGIGPYSARAVAAIAFDQPVGAVDTNVRRWLVRRFAVDVADRRRLQIVADRLARASPGLPGAAGTWTHATMEFGARICTARAPRCADCPIARGCPSRRDPPRVSVPKASAATAATRAARGALLRALAEAPGHRLPERRALRAAQGAMGADPVEVIAKLEQDGLVHRDRRAVALGPS
jgi:A/G-specific adenine glycosylase